MMTRYGPRCLRAWRCGHSQQIDGESEIDVQLDVARSKGRRRARTKRGGVGFRCLWKGLNEGWRRTSRSEWVLSRGADMGDKPRLAVKFTAVSFFELSVKRGQEASLCDAVSSLCCLF